MPYMKALSIKQPWAWLIVNGKKAVENRSWSTGFRGRIYVHAGLTPSNPSDVPEWWRYQKQYEDWLSVVRMGGFGAIVGEVDIVDCVCDSPSPWYEGPYGFVLRNPTAYPEPIPYKGALGFFQVRLPGATP